MPGIASVDRHMDNCADAAAFLIFQPQTLHQPSVARCNTVPVNCPENPFPADLFNIGYAAAVKLPSVRTLQAFADRVG